MATEFRSFVYGEKRKGGRPRKEHKAPSIVIPGGPHPCDHLNEEKWRLRLELQGLRMKKHRFNVRSKAIDLLAIPKNHREVLHWIDRYTRKNFFGARPKAATGMKETELSQNRFFEALASLEQNGLIIRHSGKGRGTTNEYEICESVLPLFTYGAKDMKKYVSRKYRCRKDPNYYKDLKNEILSGVYRSKGNFNLPKGYTNTTLSSEDAKQDTSVSSPEALRACTNPGDVFFKKSATEGESAVDLSWGKLEAEGESAEKSFGGVQRSAESEEGGGASSVKKNPPIAPLIRHDASSAVFIPNASSASSMNGASMTQHVGIPGFTLVPGRDLLKDKAQVVHDMAHSALCDERGVMKAVLNFKKYGSAEISWRTRDGFSPQDLRAAFLATASVYANLGLTPATKGPVDSKGNRSVRKKKAAAPKKRAASEKPKSKRSTHWVVRTAKTQGSGGAVEEAIFSKKKQVGSKSRSENPHEKGSFEAKRWDYEKRTKEKKKQITEKKTAELERREKVFEAFLEACRKNNRSPGSDRMNKVDHQFVDKLLGKLGDSAAIDKFFLFVVQHWDAYRKVDEKLNLDPNFNQIIADWRVEKIRLEMESVKPFVNQESAYDDESDDDRSWTI